MKFEIEGLSDLMSLPDKIREFVKFDLNFRGMESDLEKIITEQNQQELDTETGPDGEEWVELNKDYKKYKTRVKPGKKILNFDGKLEETLTHPKAMLDGSGQEATILYSGEHAILIVFHTLGAGRLPVRQVGGLSQESQDKISAIVFNKLINGFGERLKKAKKK